MLTAEQIYNQAENLHPDSERKQRIEVNRAFREQDDSHKWPIDGKFSVIERAIRRARKFERDSGVPLYGLEYPLFLEQEEMIIVNNEGG